MGCTTRLSSSIHLLVFLIVDIECPYRCRDTDICLLDRHQCDGWYDCPQRDDEENCGKSNNSPPPPPPPPLFHRTVLSDELSTLNFGIALLWLRNCAVVQWLIHLTTLQPGYLAIAGVIIIAGVSVRTADADGLLSVEQIVIIIIIDIFFFFGILYFSIDLVYFSLTYQFCKSL